MISSDIMLWLAKASIVASLLALAVIFSRNWLSRHIGARGAVLLWSLPALRLLMPPLPKFSTPEISEPSVVTTSTIDMAAFLATMPAAAAPIEVAVAKPEFDWFALIPFLLMTWAAGMVFFLGRIILETLSFQRAIRHGETAIPQDTYHSAQRAADEAGLRSLPKLIMTSAVETPQLVGFFRPAVILPAHFDDMYTPFEQRHALLHELIHYRRGDILTAWLGVFLVSVQWFNPLAHWALRLFRVDQEKACDEAVRALGIHSREYAETLVKSVRVGLSPAPALTLNHGLADRLKSMGRPLPSTLLLRTATIAIGATALAGATSTASTFMIDPPSTEEVDEVISKAPTTSQQSQTEDRQRLEQERAELNRNREELSLRKEELARQRAEQAKRITEAKTKVQHYYVQKDGKIIAQGNKGTAPVVVHTHGDDGTHEVTIHAEDGDHRFEVDGENVFVLRGEDGNYSIKTDIDEALAIIPEITSELAGEMAFAFAGTDSEAPRIHRIRVHRDEDTYFYLVGNPFAGIEPPEAPKIKAPEPPEMPAAAAEPPAPQDVEGGQWVFIPDVPDMTEFEAEMEVFGEEMEAFGEVMEKFGERMERIGEVVSDLADDCQDHLDDSTSMKLLSKRNPETRGEIKALCMPKGTDRPSDAEITAFIDRQRGLSRTEKEELKSEGGWN